MIASMESTVDILDKLEKKTIFYYDDYMDFIKVKTIVGFIVKETKK